MVQLVISFQDSDVKKFILCERWKKVERPLRHSSHLLDLWTAWGQDRQTVRWGVSLSYNTPCTERFPPGGPHRHTPLSDLELLYLVSLTDTNWFLIQVCPEENPEDREETSQPEGLQALEETTERPEQRHQVSDQKYLVEDILHFYFQTPNCPAARRQGGDPFRI